MAIRFKGKIVGKEVDAKGKELPKPEYNATGGLVMDGAFRNGHLTQKLGKYYKAWQDHEEAIDLAAEQQRQMEREARIKASPEPIYSLTQLPNDHPDYQPPIVSQGTIEAVGQLAEQDRAEREETNPALRIPKDPTTQPALFELVEAVTLAINDIGKWLGFNDETLQDEELTFLEDEHSALLRLRRILRQHQSWAHDQILEGKRKE